MDEARTISHILINGNKLKQMSKDDSKEDKLEERINIDEALWDQNTYIGRWKQMAFISDFRTIFVPEKKLWEAKKLCDDYALGQIGPEDIKKVDIIYAKKLYDSAFHPDNEELMNPFGRMSFQLPGNAILLMAMMTFYKSMAALLGLQVIHQAFNTIVNHTNRSIKPNESNELEDNEDSTVTEQAFLYSAVVSCVTALGLKKLFFCFYYRYPWVILPIELSLCLASLIVMIPSALALFPWCNSMKPELMKICPKEYNEFMEKIKQEDQPERIYYNKGL